jgi:hypothetical protein
MIKASTVSRIRNRVVVIGLLLLLLVLLFLLFWLSRGIRRPEEGKLFSSSFFFSSAQNVQNNRMMENDLLMFKPDIIITFFTTNSSQSLFSSVSSNAATINWYRIEPQGKEGTNERKNEQTTTKTTSYKGRKKTKERIISNLLHRHLTNHKGIKRTLNYCGVEAGCCLSLFSACMKSKLILNRFSKRKKPEKKEQKKVPFDGSIAIWRNSMFFARARAAIRREGDVEFVYEGAQILRQRKEQRQQQQNYNTIMKKWQLRVWNVCLECSVLSGNDSRTHTVTYLFRSAPPPTLGI